TRDRGVGAGRRAQRRGTREGCAPEKIAARGFGRAVAPVVAAFGHGFLPRNRQRAVVCSSSNCRPASKEWSRRGCVNVHARLTQLLRQNSGQCASLTIALAGARVLR